ncbi:VOC family protein [Oceanidesulfovibrio marinus]|uniref:VOC family protein n=1 Tax=Oceanidesulfovibrio marinus TaxID=370038 RepID=A0A6P1ZLR1_9BACT|nr:VOC family protein [Oceanidesulfovibrio marinus]TVM36034.1 VOC family protein [Oceanidesulfovibrio marinus]
MPTRFAHTNIVSKDWRALSAFYQKVFGCVPVPPQRALSGDWLDRGTGLANAVLEGEHLRLPGHGDAGPTLEIFSYQEMLDRPEPAANRIGLCHIAFAVDDVRATFQSLLEHGGTAVGEVVEREVPGVGLLTMVYAADPEGNIIELQNWS